VSIEFTTTAAREVRTAAQSLTNALGLRVARTFQRRLRDTLDGLEAFPLAGSPVDPPYPNFPGLRFRPVKGFESRVVFYDPTPTGIRVVRVVHANQDLDAEFN
jgi:plasmid stabilization system protein ParE